MQVQLNTLAFMRAEPSLHNNHPSPCAGLQVKKDVVDRWVQKLDAAMTLVRHTDTKTPLPDGFVKSAASFISSTLFPVIY